MHTCIPKVEALCALGGSEAGLSFTIHVYIYIYIYIYIYRYI